MKMRLIISIILVMFLLSACGGTNKTVDEVTTTNPPATTQDVAIEDISADLDDLVSIDADLDEIEITGLDDLDW